MALSKNSDQKWLVQATDVGKSGFSTELYTYGTYLDRNIVVDVDVKQGSVTLNPDSGIVTVSEGVVDSSNNIILPNAAQSAEVTVKDADYLSNTSTKYPIVVNGTGTTTQGYIKEDTTINAASVTKYIKAGSVANDATSGVTYTETNPGAIASGDYLYINEGYQGATKISLANLVPDDATITRDISGKNAYLYIGQTAYDKDGNLVTGSMQDATVTLSAEIDSSNTQTINVNDDTVVDSGNTYVSTGYNLNIAGKVSATNTIGYLATTDAIPESDSFSGEVNANLILPKASISGSISSSTPAQPVLTNNTIAIEGVTDASASGATTIMPESGVYVRVDATGALGIKGKATIAPSITTSGYVKSGQEIAGTDIEITLSDAAPLYVPIKQGSASVIVPTVDVSNGITITGDQTEGYKVNISGVGETSRTVTAGWISSIKSTEVEISGSNTLEASTIDNGKVVGTDFITTVTEGYNGVKLYGSVPVYQGEISGD